MIISFGNKDTKKIWEGERIKGLSRRNFKKHQEEN
jgi:hypothetical protein